MVLSVLGSHRSPRACNPHRRDVIAQLRDRSLELYPDFCQELRSETGIDPEYEPCGELEIALNSDALHSLRENRQAGTGSESIQNISVPMSFTLPKKLLCWSRPLVAAFWGRWNV